MPEARGTKGRATWLIALAFAVGCGSGGDATGVGSVETIGGDSVDDHRLAVETFVQPAALAVDQQGNLLVAESDRVRRVDARSGRITTIAGTDEAGACGTGGRAAAGCFNQLTGLAIGPDGALYASEHGSRIVRIDAAGTLERIAGRPYDECTYTFEDSEGAPATETCLFPDAIALDQAGDVYATTGLSASPIVRVDARTGWVATVALRSDLADGATGPPAACLPPFGGLAAAPDGTLVIASVHAVCRVDPRTGVTRVVAGTGIEPCPPNGDVDGGLATQACLAPRNVAVADDGTIAVVDDGRVRLVDPGTGRIRRLGDEPPESYAVTATFDHAGGLFVSATGSWGFRVLRHDLARGGAVRVAGNGTVGICGDGGLAASACFEWVTDVTVAPDGDVLTLDGARVRRIEAATGTIETIGGDDRHWDLPLSDPFCRDGAPATETCFHEPRRIARDPRGNVFVIDGGDFEPEVRICDRVRRIDAASGIVTTVLGGGHDSAVDDGDGVAATGACFGELRALAIGTAGELLAASAYAVWRLDPASRRAHAVLDARQDREMPPCGSGRGPTGSCLRVDDIAVDVGGELLVLSASQLTEYEDVRLLRLDATSGRLAVVAGGRPPGRCGDGGPAVDACIMPGRVLAESTGDVLLAGGGTVRRIQMASGVITTVVGPRPGFEGACHADLDGHVFAPPPCASALALDGDGRALYVEARWWLPSRPRLRRLTLR